MTKTPKQWQEKFEDFIYERFFDNYTGYGKLGVEAYEDYRNNMNDDDYMELGGAFGAWVFKQTTEDKIC